MAHVAAAVAADEPLLLLLMMMTNLLPHHITRGCFLPRGPGPVSHCGYGVRGDQRDAQGTVHARWPEGSGD